MSQSNNPPQNGEASASSSNVGTAFRPVAMFPMLNMMNSKFKGKDSEISFGEWKSNLETMFVLQGIPQDYRAELTLCCLEGKAKREILILPREKRITAELIFNELEKLYGDRTTASVLRSQFFNARQDPHEDVGSFALRLQEYFQRLKKKDSRGIGDDDVLLRDHLVDGLRDSSVRGEFRTKILIDDSLTFDSIKNELVLREQAYGETVGHLQCFNTRGDNCINKHNVKDLEQIKSELKEEMTKHINSQFNELSQSLIKEVRAELAQARVPNSDFQQTTRDFRPRFNSNRYDESGNPICNRCSQPGHIARYCQARARSHSLN